MKTVIFLALLCCATADAQNITVPLPELPATLKSIKASPRSHKHAKGAELTLKNNVLGIRLNSVTPLTPEQWDAVASLHPRSFNFNDRALRDEDMDRLVALDPVEVELRITPLTGKGAAKFAEMRSLTKLVSHHLLTPTPEAKALATHPTLDHCEPRQAARISHRLRGQMACGLAVAPRSQGARAARDAADKHAR
jgi:hypothetical protein